MLLWQVKFARQVCCTREYRDIGEVPAANILEALDVAVEKYGDLGEDDESLCVHWEPRRADAWALIAGPDLV